MIVADDWGGGDWWEFQPPPPDDDDRDQWENWEEDYEYSPIGIPPEPDWPEVDLENINPDHVSPEVEYTAWDFLVDIENVDPKTIRGIAFGSIHEAVSWLTIRGLIGFSVVVYSEGFYYPSIGESQANNPTR